MLLDVLMGACLRILLAIAAAFSLACAGVAPPSGAPAPAPDLIATTFQGQVEVPEGDGSGAVIVSTATEEVVVAPTAAAQQLRRLEGRTVTLHGWVVDRPQQTLVMVVTSFQVDGEQHSFLQVPRGRQLGR